MNALSSPVLAYQFDEHVATAVRGGLTAQRKTLPAWLFYDAAGSRLFDEITKLDEYYLTRAERAIFSAHARAIVAKAANGAHLRIAELGAGSADKTRLLLHAAVALQKAVHYEPVDVSATALIDAQQRIEREIAGVKVAPNVMDYTRGDRQQLDFGSTAEGERRLVLYIGSSIGNFEPRAAAQLLGRVRAGLAEGDSILLGIDLVKHEDALVRAYDDARGVTAAFNRNLLIRLNRELDANFSPECFTHRAVWNREQSRIEMHLVSRVAQNVRIAALDLTISFTAGESIHTENSYKFTPGKAKAMLADAGFSVAEPWTDADNQFAVFLGAAC